MRTINITSARKELYSLVEAVNCDSVPVLITGEKWECGINIGKRLECDSRDSLLKFHSRHG